MYRKALKIQEDVLGDHPDTAATYTNVGSVLCGMRDDDGAKEMYKKALAIQEAVLGDHPDTAATRINMGSVLQFTTNSPTTDAEALRALAS
jgi:Tfp pilus assembly protein PilF